MCASDVLGNVLSRIARHLASCTLVLCVAVTNAAALGADILYTFDNDQPSGPYADALGADGAQDATWWWEGTPGIDREQPIFGAQSLVTTKPAPIELGLASDLGPEVTFSVHVRNVEPGVNTLVSNWVGRAIDGGMFIAFDPASKYAHDGIFMRFHHWRQTAQGLTSLELVIPPIADWSRDGKIHHIAVTFNHGTVTAYLDGTRLGETKGEAQEFDHLDLRPARHSLLFGAGPSANPFALVGTCDDLLILSRSLSADEIVALCKQGAVGSGLVKADLVRRATTNEPAQLLSEAETRQLTTPVASGSAGTKSPWTFETARRQWHPMIRPVQHVGVPDTNGRRPCSGTAHLSSAPSGVWKAPWPHWATTSCTGAWLSASLFGSSTAPAPMLLPSSGLWPMADCRSRLLSRETVTCSGRKRCLPTCWTASLRRACRPNRMTS